MKFNKITPSLIAQLIETFGKNAVFTDAETLDKHSRDYTENLSLLPEVVVEPQNTEGVATLLKFCNEQLIPVTVQGARSGLAGGALPAEGGVVLSMKRFDRILEIDNKNFQVKIGRASCRERV